MIKPILYMFIDIFYNLPKGILKAIKLSRYIGKYEIDESQGGPSNSEKHWWDANIVDNIIPALFSLAWGLGGIAFIANECHKKGQATLFGSLAIAFLLISILAIFGKKV